MSGGGGGGGGGGTGGGVAVTPGGVLGRPGGGTGGGTGRSVSGCTHADRSKNRNSSAFSCADAVIASQPMGKGTSGRELSSFSSAGAGAALTWMSVCTTRPHCASAGASTGVLNVWYWFATRLGVIGSFGFIGM